MAVRASRPSDVLQALDLRQELAGLVDGEWTAHDDAQPILVEDPATATVVASVAEADASTVDAAVRSAYRAFTGPWGRHPPAQRGHVLLPLADVIRRRAEELAGLETLDTGKPLSQARSDVAAAARYFEFYAGATDKITSETIPQPAGILAYTAREPYGVVAHVIPWNSPAARLARGVAPSLAAGNTVVVKPSELAPLGSLAVARLFVEAGLPAGACNVVPGHGPSTGSAVVRHPLVGHVTFTGSVATGRAALADDTDYGLAAEVFTRDFAAAHRVAGRLQAGQVHIDKYPIGGVETPFGGYKQSGIDREKELEALHHYTRLKTVIAHVPAGPR